MVPAMRRARIALRRGLLFVLCLAAVILVRISLYITKFTTLRTWLVSPTARKSDNAARVHIVARTISRAARCVPGATCLTQALAGQAVLSWFDVDTDLVIGAAGKASEGAGEDTEFHAWLIWRETILLGGEELSQRRFVPLSRMSSEHP